ncbi:MAG: hypothetical protein J6A89_07685 [Clostridia bacterium]|nr:hypothetical protein [Clostridia bacterium]
MKELNEEIIEKVEVSEQEAVEIQNTKIIEYFCTYILVCNFLYFVANNDIFTVYLLLQTINADIEFFEGNKHYDYDSIERQYIHAKKFYEKGQDEEIAKIKASIYYLYQKLDMSDNSNKSLDDKIELTERIFDVIIDTLEQFFDSAYDLISNDIEGKFTDKELGEVFFNKLYHNMKAEKLITKSKFEKLLK